MVADCNGGLVICTGFRAVANEEMEIRRLWKVALDHQPHISVKGLHELWPKSHQRDLQSINSFSTFGTRLQAKVSKSHCCRTSQHGLSGNCAAGNGQDIPPPNKYNKRDSAGLEAEGYVLPLYRDR